MGLLEGQKFHVLDPFPTHIASRHGAYDIDEHQLLNASLVCGPQIIEVLKQLERTNLALASYHHDLYLAHYWLPSRFMLIYHSSMQSEPFALRASKFQCRLYGIASLLLSLLCMWLGYQLAIGKPFWHGFLLALFLALFTVAMTIRLYSEKLQYTDGRLILKSVFAAQSVYLPSLVRAERYVTRGRFPNPMLRLEDEAGGGVTINPGDYTTNDLNKLVSLISPYVFTPSVNKNFMDLQFYIDQNGSAPKSSFLHILRGTFLFILLPCIVLTLLLIIWAIATKQPAFR